MANTDSERVDYGNRLRSLMTQVGIPSFRALSQTSGLSRSAIDNLRRGRASQLRVSTLQRLSQTLGISLEQLVSQFSRLTAQAPAEPAPAGMAETAEQIKALRQECDRLQTQLTSQAETVRQQLQQEAIAQLEPWLVQWPTAAHAAQQRDDLPAHKLIPLVRPVEALVQQWGVTALETVGAEVGFDPTVHQPKAGCIPPGQVVRVTHVGYRWGDRLLHRARVTPLKP